MHAAGRSLVHFFFKDSLFEQAIPAIGITRQLFILAAAPNFNVLTDTPSTEGDGDDGGDIDADFAPEGHIPEARADRKIRGERCGHKFGSV